MKKILTILLSAFITISLFSSPAFALDTDTPAEEEIVDEYAIDYHEVTKTFYNQMLVFSDGYQYADITINGAIQTNATTGDTVGFNLYSAQTRYTYGVDQGEGYNRVTNIALQSSSYEISGDDIIVYVQFEATCIRGSSTLKRTANFSGRLSY